MFELLNRIKKQGSPIVPGSYSRIRLAMLRAPMYVTIDEVECREKASGTNWTKLSGTTTQASSTYPGYSTSGVISGILGTVSEMWCPNQGNNANINRSCWWQVTFSEPRFVDSVRIACSLGFGREPNDIAVMGSNDGIEWTDLIVRTNLTWQDRVYQEMLI